MHRFLAPLAKKYLAEPGSVADVERPWSRSKWLGQSHGPSMHQAKALTQILSLGENAEGLGMLAKTPRSRAGAAKEAPQAAEPEALPDSVPLHSARLAAKSAASSGEGGFLALVEEEDVEMPE